MSSRGFSLIEALISMVLLSVVASMMLAAWPSLAELNRSSTRDVDVTTAAKMYYENVRVSWQDRSTFDAGTLPAAPAPDGYTCSSSVSDPDGGTYTPAIRKRVEMTCTPEAGQSGADRFYVLEFGRP